MQITLKASADDKCVLSEVTISMSMEFVVPVGIDGLVDGLTNLMIETESKELHVGDVILEKTQSMVKIHAGHGAFHIPFIHLFPILISRGEDV